MYEHGRVCLELHFRMSQLIGRARVDIICWISDGMSFEQRAEGREECRHLQLGCSWQKDQQMQRPCYGNRE